MNIAIAVAVSVLWLSVVFAGAIRETWSVWRGK
jgi:hypothetical protein